MKEIKEFSIIQHSHGESQSNCKKRISHEGKEFLQALLRNGFEAQVEVRENEDTIIYNIISKDGGVIIGRRGETLMPFILTGLVVNKTAKYIKRLS